MQRRTTGKERFGRLLVAIWLLLEAIAAHSEGHEERKDTSQLEWPVTGELRKYGIKLKMPYAEARERMLRNGWKPDLAEAELRYQGNYRPYRDFPEILCGEGYDAICSAPFIKGKDYHTIEVREHKGKLVVRGASE
jgi:hypothetical protein